ncbi:hypothetical protein GCM10020254_03060 [Streptomyces goshikiensis]
MWAESMFRSVTRSFGFAPVTVAPVGYAETFEQFGSAATGRIFAFEDLSGRRLALTADSLVAVLRALAGSGRLTGGASALGAACVPIARYRRKRHRGWSQAVAVICNEADELAADLTLLRLWAELFEVLGPGRRGAAGVLRLRGARRDRRRRGAEPRRRPQRAPPPSPRAGAGGGGTAGGGARSAVPPQGSCGAWTGSPSSAADCRRGRPRTGWRRRSR